MMKYSRITFETGGGRLISIVKDDTIEYGDVDYIILYNRIPTLVDALGEMGMEHGSQIREEHARKLIDLGLLIPVQP